MNQYKKGYKTLGLLLTVCMIVSAFCFSGVSVAFAEEYPTTVTDGVASLVKYNGVMSSAGIANALGETAPVTQAYKAVCTTAASMINTGGIRQGASGVFEVNQANSIIAVEYYVSATADTTPKIASYLQYTKEDKSSSGDKLIYDTEANSIGGATVQLTNGEWQKRIQCFNVELPTGTDANKQYLRFVVGCSGVNNQTTYVGGLKIFNFGSSYAYEGENGLKAVQKYLGILTEDPPTPPVPDPDPEPEPDDNLFTVETNPLPEGLSLLQSGDTVIGGFAGSFYDSSKGGIETMENAPVSTAFKVVSREPTEYGSGSASSAIVNFGIRNKADQLLDIDTEGTYLVASYWVMAELGDGATVEKPQILGRMQYCGADGNNGSSTIDAVAGISNTIDLDNGTWYRCFQIFQVDTPTDENRLRFMLYCGHLMQTTYIADYRLYTASCNFELNGKSGADALLSYINDSAVSDITYDGVSVDGFTSEKSGYIINASSDMKVTKVYADAFAEITTNIAPALGKKVEFEACRFDADTVTPYGTYSDRKNYSLYYRTQNPAVILSSILTDEAMQPVNAPGVGNYYVKTVVNKAASDTQLLVSVSNRDNHQNCGVYTAPLIGTQEPLEITVPIVIAKSGNYTVEAALVKTGENSIPQSDAFVALGEKSILSSERTEGEALLSVTQNFDTGLIEVGGQLADALPLRYTAVVKENNAEAATVFAGVYTAASDGSFALNFLPKENLSVIDYCLSVYDEKAQTPYSTNFTWYSDTVLKNAVDWFQTASAVQVATALASGDNLIGAVVKSSVLFGSALEDYSKLKNPVPVQEALAGKTFLSAKELLKAFETALQERTICEAFEFDTGENLEKDIADYSQSLGLYTDAQYGYNSLDEAAKADVCRRVQTASCKNTATLQSVFNKAVILNVFETLSWGDLSGAATQYAYDLQLELASSKYQTLTEAKKATLFKTLAAADFSDVGEIKPLFDQTLKELTASSASSGSGGGGGGKNSGSGSAYGGYATYNDSAANENQPQTGELPFADVRSGDWEYEYVVKLYNKGIINGDGNGNYSPQSGITRAEFVKLLVVAFGFSGEKDSTEFTDCLGKWYESYVSAAVQTGIVNGKNDGSFGGDEPITRQDLCVMAHRSIVAAGKKLPKIAESESFADADVIADYAKTEVAAMQRAGILSGVGNNRFAPLELSDRAMAAKIIACCMALQ